MAEWTINGFKITMYQADHPPLHCHSAQRWTVHREIQS